MRLVPIVRDQWAVLVLTEHCGQTPRAGRVDTSATALCIGRSGRAPHFAWTRSASANLLCIRLHNCVAVADLAVAAEGNDSVFTDTEDRRRSPDRALVVGLHR